MINEAPEFVSAITLARMYDTSNNEIKETVQRLKQRGHKVDTIKWGKQGKLKINLKQFRVAVYAEYKGE